MKLNREELWTLRNEIVLNSLFSADFRNSFHIEEHACQNYFDGYADYLQELMNEDGLDGGNHFSEYLDRYDTADNLYNWELCFVEDNHFPIDKEWVVTEAEYDIDNALAELVFSCGWDEKDYDTKYTEVLNEIMKIVSKYEEKYPELKSGDDDEMWYDEMRGNKLENIEEYIDY